MTPPDHSGAAARLLPPTARAALMRVRRAPLRRGLLLLLVVALLPAALISFAQGWLRLERDRANVAQQLSENALATASAERNAVGRAQAVLRMLSQDDDVAAGGARCAAALARANALFPDFADIQSLDARGRPRCASPAAVALGGRAWWPRFVDQRRFLVAPDVETLPSGRRALRAALPIVDRRGRLTGALVAGIDLDRLGADLRARYVGRDAAVAVVDRAGRPLLTAGDALPALLPPVEQAGAVRNARGRDARTWVYATAPLTEDAAVQLAYAMPQARLFGGTLLHVGIDLLLPLLTILFGSLAIWTGADRLVLRWLGRLRALADDFAAGRYGARERDFSAAPAEMRSVAGALYRMGDAIRDRDETLQGSLARQKRLAREVHHRVKNNLQIVMSLLSLQAGRLQDGGGRRALELARNRISALALVHRLLYETDEAQRISSRRLIGEVASQLQLVYRPPAGVRVAGEFADVPVSIDAAVPLTLWLVETLSNAFLYAFPPGRQGTVQVRLEADAERLRLSVADDGVGFDAPALLAARPLSNGLRLMQAIGQQLGGATRIESTPGRGAAVSLDVPRPELREVETPP